MSRVPIVQKFDSKKEKNVSHSNNVMITDLETGEIICQNCGVVLQEKISLARKLDNIFTNNEYSSYAGNRSTLRIYDMGLATNIGTSNYDSTGRPLDYKIKPFMKRLRLWDARSKSKSTSERNL
jgi:transcription initiation factor TFIIB